MMADVKQELAEKLERVLEEPVAHATYRERSTFQQLRRGSSGRVVIYGAGSLGRRIRAGLGEMGIEVVAFVDRNPDLWSKTVDGVKVLSPTDASAAYGRHDLFIVAVWHPMRAGGVESIINALRTKGCEHIVSFVPLFWQECHRFLPFYLWDSPSRVLSASNRIRAAFHLFDRDPESQKMFLEQLDLRIQGDFKNLTSPTSHEQYFPPFLKRMQHERFIDCGAFDGDTTRTFLSWAGGEFGKIIAFEPDPINATALRDFALTCPDLEGRFEIRTEAIGDVLSTRTFDASGSANAALSDKGTAEVQVTTLDEAFGTENTTFIKMDIESQELAALQGGKHIIRRDRPVLAICAYHLQDHLWEVPLQMAALVDDYFFALRCYRTDGFDTVCYAIPVERYIPSPGDCR